MVNRRADQALLQVLIPETSKATLDELMSQENVKSAAEYVRLLLERERLIANLPGSFTLSSWGGQREKTRTTRR